MSEIKDLKRAIKNCDDPKVREILQVALRSELIKIVGLTINSLAIILITIGYIFWSYMGFWLTEFHGALTGIFLLGTVKYLLDASYYRRNT